MLVLSVKIGQAVQIGEAACVKVEEKSGRGIRLRIASALSPIRLLADGVIPARFTPGISEQPARFTPGLGRILEPVDNPLR